MELEGRCFMMDAFSITTIHPAIWDPWSMETNFVIGKNRSPSHRPDGAPDGNARLYTTGARNCLGSHTQRVSR